MSEHVDFYLSELNLKKTSWLADLQKEGLNSLKKLGFPTRTHENWKYTEVTKLLDKRFTESTAKQSSIEKTTLPALGIEIKFHNGLLLNEDELATKLPKGLKVQSLEQALQSDADKIKPFLGQALAVEHGFQALNTAKLDKGLVIFVAAGTEIKEPLVISYWQDEENQLVNNRCLIVAEDASKATIIEYYHGKADCCYLTNTVTEVFTQQNAHIEHYKIQNESKAAFHIGHIAVKEYAKSQFNSHSLSLGGKLVRSDLSIDLLEERAGCLLNGIYAPGENQHVDHHTKVNHLVPHCESEQDYKGVLKDNSRAVFNGIVYVAKNAVQTRAKQQNKNLLLAKGAEVDTKPQLEIFADDVVCTHGATVGQLDEDALFYLATRGIDKAEASRYLVNAFSEANLAMITNSALKEWMTHLLNEQLS